MERPNHRAKVAEWLTSRANRGPIRGSQAHQTTTIGRQDTTHDRPVDVIKRPTEATSEASQVDARARLAAQLFSAKATESRTERRAL